MEYTTKRKSFAQRDAQLKATEAARGAAARRAEERRRAAQAEDDRQRERDNHQHSWRNWEYTEDYTHETRTCREHYCNATETRAVRL
jgi:hypothetical protein